MPGNVACVVTFWRAVGAHERKQWRHLSAANVWSRLTILDRVSLRCYGSRLHRLFTACGFDVREAVADASLALKAMTQGGWKGDRD